MDLGTVEIYSIRNITLLMIKKYPDQSLKRVQIMGKSGAAIASKSAAIASKTRIMMQKDA